LRGVHKLPQSHAAIYELDTDTLRLWRYWRLPDPPSPDAHASADELTDELEVLLEDAVRRQLLADVPVGILLSGGIDSSLVTAMAARVSSTPVKTFTISFPGYDNYDEGPYARLVAQHFGTEHTELVAEPASVELLPTLARQYDEPLVDSSMVPTYLVSRLIRQHATVALGGDGGDELFGGYPHHAWFQRYETMRPWLINPLRAWEHTLVERLPVGFRGRNYLLRLTAPDLREGLAAPGHFDTRARRQLLATRLDQNTYPLPETYKLALCSDRRTAVQTATALDFMTYLVEDILVKVDRASMLNSLEVRAPWLDYRIIEFAFGRVPDSLRATQTERKILPRRLAQRLLPPALDLKRKQGFSLPLNHWFKGDWGAYMEAVLREADPHLFDRRMIQTLITNQRRGYFNNMERLFALTLFELWRREYRISL
jgi:asparagine synthase (glutamine-hydrolysing)